MPALTIFHDVSSVSAEKPFADPAIRCNLGFNDNKGGRVVLALSDASYSALKLALEAFEAKEKASAQ